MNHNTYLSSACEIGNYLFLRMDRSKVGSGV
jgi:hypothetical protein